MIRLLPTQTIAGRCPSADSVADSGSGMTPPVALSENARRKIERVDLDKAKLSFAHIENGRLVRGGGEPHREFSTAESPLG